MALSAEGVLNINKPAGLTSHDVVNHIRRVTGIKRIGHTGTLDPLATGVLLLCVGRATRLAEYLVGQDKRYRALIHLGKETDTYDREGQVVSELPVEATHDDVEKTLECFRGEIQQQAPAYSAIKVGGEALYKKARRGEKPDSPTRNVTVYEITLQSWNTPFLEIELLCSSGTYIRSIAHDIGRALGCGGSLETLIRLSVGDFSIDDAIGLEDMDSENWRSPLHPLDSAVSHLARIVVSLEQAERLGHGQLTPVSGDWDEGTMLRVYDEQANFVGITNFTDGCLKAKKIFYQPLPAPE
ncbi:MAG: tRNA pseudouridine(55) synthase TruB [Candidatus Promineifilaceae bacterium]